MNKSGPNIGPCGTPVEIFVKDDLILLILTHFFLFFSNFRLILVSFLGDRKI